VKAEIDLTRCSHCGRTGTLTCLSAGNTCVLQDECEAARQETLARAAILERRGDT
jgi:hypothetical protein